MARERRKTFYGLVIYVVMGVKKKYYGMCAACGVYLKISRCVRAPFGSAQNRIDLLLCTNDFVVYIECRLFSSLCVCARGRVEGGNTHFLVVCVRAINHDRRTERGIRYIW